MMVMLRITLYKVCVCGEMTKLFQCETIDLNESKLCMNNHWTVGLEILHDQHCMTNRACCESFTSKWLRVCLSFFDLRILITPLVSSNSSSENNNNKQLKSYIEFVMQCSKDRQHNGQTKMSKGQTTIYKTLHIKLKIE
jgi:hypothetical protein